MSRPVGLSRQSIGRLGNYFNQELFGAPTSLPWGLEIDPAHRPPGYEGFTTCQPTFLYEIVWNLALAAFLVWLGRRGRVRPPGLFALYVAGYSGFRIFEELLRVDPAHHIFGLRLIFYVAFLLCAIGLAWLVLIQSGTWRRGPSRRGAGVIVVAAAIALAGCRQPSTSHAAPAPQVRAAAHSGLHEAWCNWRARAVLEGSNGCFRQRDWMWLPDWVEIKTEPLGAGDGG